MVQSEISAQSQHGTDAGPREQSSQAQSALTLWQRSPGTWLHCLPQAGPRTALMQHRLTGVEIMPQVAPSHTPCKVFPTWAARRGSCYLNDCSNDELFR